MRTIIVLERINQTYSLNNNVPGKYPLLGNHPCTEFQWVMADPVKRYMWVSIYAGYNSELHVCLSTHGHLSGILNTAFTFSFPPALHPSRCIKVFVKSVLSWSSRCTTVLPYIAILMSLDSNHDHSSLHSHRISAHSL